MHTLQTQGGSEQDFFLAVLNNIQDLDTKNPAKSAGKFLIYTKGKSARRFRTKGIQRFKRKLHCVCKNVAYNAEDENFGDGQTPSDHDDQQIEETGRYETEEIVPALNYPQANQSSAGASQTVWRAPEVQGEGVETLEDNGTELRRKGREGEKGMESLERKKKKEEKQKHEKII